MSRHLILHIGMPKCGSTYLQSVLLQNQTALSEAGFAYPHPSGEGHPGNGQEFEKITPPALEELFGPHHTLIISFERLYRVGSLAEPLAAALQKLGATVEILAFIRPFSELVLGTYSQEMKQNFSRYLKARSPYDGKSFEEMAQAQALRPSPTQRLSEWRKALNGAPITLSGHRTIRAVLEPRLPGATLDWSVPLRKVNRSLRKADCDRLAEMIRDPSLDEAAIIEERKAAFKRAGEPDPARSPELIQWLENLFTAQNEELQSAFGYDNRSRP